MTAWDMVYDEMERQYDALPQPPPNPYTGCGRTIADAELARSAIENALGDGEKPRAIAKRLGIGIDEVYRVRAEGFRRVTRRSLVETADEEA